MPDWAYDHKPLMEWFIEARMREKYHLTTIDIEEMDYEKYLFFLGLMEAEISEQIKANKKMEHQMKTRR